MILLNISNFVFNSSKYFSTKYTCIYSQKNIIIHKFAGKVVDIPIEFDVNPYSAIKCILFIKTQQNPQICRYNSTDKLCISNSDIHFKNNILKLNMISRSNHIQYSKSFIIL